MVQHFDLVIFDCDGVLVDSEMLSAEVLMAMMAEAGLPITPEIFRADFLGRSFAAAAARAEERFGRPLPPGFQAHYRKRLLAKMENELTAMPGVLELLRVLDSPYCLATSSSPERLEVSLAVTSLADFFDGRSFTASEVERGKPAPDLFLYAAGKMAVQPSRCIVVEDSEMGLRAARAAGMAAWHYTGGSHVKAGYHLPEDVVPDRSIASMKELGEALSLFGLCRKSG
ncbi:HAD family hydrolase [Aestuariivirga sp.]|jgi:HAD superfamily hydrolase (TIGR01509 family)|uniref:HAD family hydrolase n=1 Tax=Aestuariivirga sp. TaxID=2650926 RepID=UPI0037849FD3